MKSKFNFASIIKYTIKDFNFISNKVFYYNKNRFPMSLGGIKRTYTFLLGCRVSIPKVIVHHYKQNSL